MESALSGASRGSRGRPATFPVQPEHLGKTASKRVDTVKVFMLAKCGDKLFLK